MLKELKKIYYMRKLFNILCPACKQLSINTTLTIKDISKVVPLLEKSFCSECKQKLTKLTKTFLGGKK